MSKVKEAELLAAKYSQLTCVVYLDEGKRRFRIALRVGNLSDRKLEDHSVGATFVTQEVPSLQTVDSERNEYMNFSSAIRAEAKKLTKATLRGGELEVWIGNRRGTKFQRERGDRYKDHLDIFESAWREALRLPKLTDDELEDGRRQAAIRLCGPIIGFLRSGRKGLDNFNNVPNWEKRRLPEIRNESFAGLNLKKWDLRDLRFPNCDFSSGKLAEALFSRCDLTSTQFGEADLTKASVVNSVATKANFLNAKLIEASLAQSDLRKASLEGADLTKCDLSSADLRGADLTKCKLSGAEFAGAIFNEATRWPARFKVRRNMVRKK